MRLLDRVGQAICGVSEYLLVELAGSALPGGRDWLRRQRSECHAKQPSAKGPAHRLDVEDADLVVQFHADPLFFWIVED